jgi:hypothetical protein
LAKQLFPLDLELTFPYRAPHEFRNNRTLVLIAKGLVKCCFNVIWNTKINGGHGCPSPLLKLSTIKLYPSLEYGQSRFQWLFSILHDCLRFNAEAFAIYRALSGSIGAKQNILTVNLTVKFRWYVGVNGISNCFE